METRVNLQKIKDIAYEKKVTLADVAEAADITQVGLSKIMRENSTKVSTLEKIADYLGVSILDFFDIPDVVVNESPYNSNTGSVGGDFSVNADMGKMLDFVREQMQSYNDQLKVKDEQIKMLIAAINK